MLAQIVYYVSCWIKVTEATGDYAQKVSFSVPTGNFGDICAGHIARQMGLPIDRLIVATNENDVLDEFFRTGQYRPRSAADTHETSSPSMDISRASNFERFIADLLDRDAAQVAELFGQRIKDGGFALSDDLLARAREEFGFVSGRSLHSDRLATIAQVQQNHNIVVDPHTADGIKVAWDAVAEHKITSPVVCLETALPVKFAETIEEALGTTPPMPQRFAGIMDGGRKVVDLANDAEKAKDYIRTSIEQTEVR